MTDAEKIKYLEQEVSFLRNNMSMIKQKLELCTTASHPCMKEDAFNAALRITDHKFVPSTSFFIGRVKNTGQAS